MNRTILTGSRCDIEIDGINGPKRIGWGTDVRVDVRQQNIVIEPVGNPFPTVVPVGVQVDVSVAWVRILEEDPNSLGFLANLGGDDPASLVNMPEFRIKVFAKHVGGERLVAVVDGARPSGYNFTVQGRSYVAQNITFQGSGIRFTSEL